jgi:nitrate/nitrite transport system permease protein
MKTRLSIGQQSTLLSLALFGVILLVWQLATLPETHTVAADVDPEYAALMGGGGASQASSFPTPAAMGQTVWGQAVRPVLR